MSEDTKILVDGLVEDSDNIDEWRSAIETEIRGVDDDVLTNIRHDIDTRLLALNNFIDDVPEDVDEDIYNSLEQERDELAYIEEELHDFIGQLINLSEVI